MTTREKPAPLVWTASTIPDDGPCISTMLGNWCAMVWRTSEIGACRSRVCKRTGLDRDDQDHDDECAAKASAEKRLRKAGA